MFSVSLVWQPVQGISPPSARTAEHSPDPEWEYQQHTDVSEIPAYGLVDIEASQSQCPSGVCVWNMSWCSMGTAVLGLGKEAGCLLHDPIISGLHQWERGWDNRRSFLRTCSRACVSWLLPFKASTRDLKGKLITAVEKSQVCTRRAFTSLSLLTFNICIRLLINVLSSISHGFD